MSDDLLGRYLDDPEPAAAAAMAERLRADPAAIDELLDLVTIHRDLFAEAPLAASLAAAGAAAVAEDPAPAQIAAAARRRHARAHRRTTSRQRWFTVRIIVALAAMLVMVVGLGWWLAARQEPISPAETVARVVEQASDARCRTPDGTWRDLYVGRNIRAGDTIETGEDGTLTLAWCGQATTVELAEHATLVARNTSLVRVPRGQVTAHVASHAPANPFVVETPHATLTVLGTRFRVTVASDATRMAVSEGTVRIMRLSDAAQVDVPAGHEATAGAGLQLKAVPATLAMASEITWRDAMDDLEPWLVTEWREPGGIAMDISSALYRSPPAAVRLRYTMPGRAPTPSLDEWVINARSVERRVSLPDRATHLRFWLKVVSAQPDSRFAIWLTPAGRRSGWSTSVELAGMTDQWQLIEEDLRHMPEFWSRRRGTLRADEVPPVPVGTIAIVELSLNLADAEVIVDDLEFIQKDSP